MNVKKKKIIYVELDPQAEAEVPTAAVKQFYYQTRLERQTKGPLMN